MNPGSLLQCPEGHMHPRHESKQRDWMGYPVFHLSVSEPPTPKLKCPLGQNLPTPAYPLSTSGRPEGRDRKGMLKSAPSVLPNLHFPCPHAGVSKSIGQKRHNLPKKREGQAQEAGACTEHHPRDGVFLGDLLPTCHGGRRKAGPRREQLATPLNIREQL